MGGEVLRLAEFSVFLYVKFTLFLVVWDVLGTLFINLVKGLKGRTPIAHGRIIIHLAPLQPAFGQLRRQLQELPLGREPLVVPWSVLVLSCLLFF